MIFGQDRNELRSMYATTWHKYRGGGVLTPLESQIAAVIEDHPEYHEAISGVISRSTAARPIRSCTWACTSVFESKSPQTGRVESPGSSNFSPRAPVAHIVPSIA